MNTSILESKLKRHKISYTNKNGKIIIGKPKTDYGTLIGLVTLPIVAGIGICLFMILNNMEFLGLNNGKIIVGIIFLFGTGFYNLSRIRTKKQSNNNLKTLNPKEIEVKNEFGKYSFDSKNIKYFEFSSEQIDAETYEGNLFLIDNEDRKHQILGFDDENEKYVMNDLKWFSEFLMNHVDIKTSKTNNL